jgi:hypothetical protein
MDRATMLAANQENERQFKLRLAMLAVPAWPAREESVQLFAWAYGARALIAERNRVGEIRALWVAMGNNDMPDRTPSNEAYQAQFAWMCFPLSFHEAFVASDEQRALLMHRLHTLYDLHWHGPVVAMHLEGFPNTCPGSFRNEAHFDAAVTKWAAGVAPYYKIAQSTLEQHLERLLLMQALFEELKPETRELVARCVSFEELDRSMLASV